jgi:hypothetical protein
MCCLCTSSFGACCAHRLGAMTSPGCSDVINHMWLSGLQSSNRLWPPLAVLRKLGRSGECGYLVDVAMQSRIASCSPLAAPSRLLNFDAPSASVPAVLQLASSTAWRRPLSCTVTTSEHLQGGALRRILIATCSTFRTVSQARRAEDTLMCRWHCSTQMHSCLHQGPEVAGSHAHTWRGSRCSRQLQLAQVWRADRIFTGHSAQHAGQLLGIIVDSLLVSDQNASEHRVQEAVQYAAHKQ